MEDPKKKKEEYSAALDKLNESAKQIRQNQRENAQKLDQIMLLAREYVGGIKAMNSLIEQPETPDASSE